MPQKDAALARMLHAARHVQRYPATDTKRGRPSRFQREDLLKVLAHLNDILDRATSSHISVASFVDHYLRLLDFPTDVTEALKKGDINLFEAEQLARVTPERTGTPPAEARRARTALLASHLQTQASGERLRLRINEMLRAPATPSSEPVGETVVSPHASEQLEDFDPYDSTHLFWEQIKQLGFAFREIRREDVTDEDVEELLKASEPVLALLNRIRRRREHKPTVKFRV